MSISLSLSYIQIYCEMIQVNHVINPRSIHCKDRIYWNPPMAGSQSRRSLEGQFMSLVQLAYRSHLSIRYFFYFDVTITFTWFKCMDSIKDGDANRAVASTKLNATSSRSHAALIVCGAFRSLAFLSSLHVGVCGKTGSYNGQHVHFHSRDGGSSRIRKG